MTRIAILGADGATGREVVRHGVRAGWDVVAIDRALPGQTDRVEGVVYREANVMKG